MADLTLKMYPTFYEKSVEKGTLKPKIEKGLSYLFFLSLFRYLQEKLVNLSAGSLWRLYSGGSLWRLYTLD